MVVARLAALLLAGLPAVAAAQLVAVRTVPISRSHQFDFFPSLDAAMGGASIAAADSLLDPFINPAFGARTRQPRIFAAPSLYRVRSAAGDGETLPLGAIGRVGNWFGAAAFGTQQVDLSDRFGFGFQGSCPECDAAGFKFVPGDHLRGNRYGYGMLGKAFPASGVSVAASVSVTDLDWLHGVDLLYAGSSRIRQHGDGLDLRLGAAKEWNDRSLSAVLLHNRFSARHDVLFVDVVRDPATNTWSRTARVDGNLDRTNVWGAHVEYSQPIAGTSWRVGGVATTNIMSHPKIPNYVLQSIPRDPGNSTALNFGVGVSRDTAGSRIAFDFVFEPIRSHTWGEAEQPVTAQDGSVIPAGGRTVDNRFKFWNTIVRMGWAHPFAAGDKPNAVTLRLGLGAHTIRYKLVQTDLVAGTRRSLDESWTEWTPTWGLAFRVAGMELHYRGRVTGTRLGDLFDISLGGGDDVTIVDPGPSVVAAPAAPVMMDQLRVTTHQLSVLIPLR